MFQLNCTGFLRNNFELIFLLIGVKFPLLQWAMSHIKNKRKALTFWLCAQLRIRNKEMLGFKVVPPISQSVKFSFLQIFGIQFFLHHKCSTHED